MADYTWTLTTATDTIISTALLGDRPTVTRGDEVSLRFRFIGGGAFGSGSFGAGTYGGEEGFGKIRELLDYVRAVTTFQAIDGTPYYREVPTDGSSLLVEFTPGADVDIPGFYGVIVDGQDASNAPGSALRIELSVFVLAEIGEFADRSAVASARGL